ACRRLAPGALSRRAGQRFERTMTSRPMLTAFQSALLLALLAIVCAACGKPPGTPLPHTAASFAMWAPAPIERVTSASGKILDSVSVRGGELLRLELASGEKLAIGESARSGRAMAETWRDETATKGIITFRTNISTSAVLMPPGSVARALIGEPSDPG